MLSKSDAMWFWIYGWDYENRMTTARKQYKVARYQYDALGRRVFRHGKGVGATAKYTYDGLDVLMDDGSEGVVKYQNGLGIDDKLKMVTNGNAKYFLQDHLGSTVGLADSSGNVVSSASYDSFGNSTNNLSTRYQYTGREKDEFTGLMYYRARWYDANLGRFVSEDPIGFAGGDVNLFGYVKNKPLKHRDPRGLDDADIAFRETDLYKELEKQSDEFRKSLRNSPKLPECGPAEYPLLEWAVPDSVGGTFGPFSSNYKVTPPCEAHDTCYSTCGKTKETCDVQLGTDVGDSCQKQGATPRAGSFYGSGYYWGVRLLGDGAYQSAQKQSGCQLFTPDPCSKYGSWACK